MHHTNHTFHLEGVKDQISKNVDVPKDVILGVPILTITGQTELLIENHRGIIEYTERQIRIQTKQGTIFICGVLLQIQYYTNDELKITGKIKEVKFV